MTDIVIAAALRSPIGTFQGSLSSLSAVEIGTQVMQALLKKTGVPASAIDEVILGHVLTAGCGQNTARQVTLRSGLDQATPAMTINKVCGSGLKAVHLAAQAIAQGDANIVIAGGMESMSQSAHVLPHSRNGQRMGHWQAVDSMISDGLWDAFNDYHMGITAENLANQYNISREAQDAFAAASQQKASDAAARGAFDAEIVPISVPQRKADPILVTEDEGIRPNTTTETLGKLRPAFKADGSVTAGNASGINDGAAMVLVCRRDVAEQYGLTPLATIRAWASAGVDPAIMGIGPVSATKRCLAKADWKMQDIGLIEANEAFAAQSLAVAKETGWDAEKVNVNGGAIALGHPIGASGCRVLVTLIHAMHERQVSKGLATLCIGGGQGVAIAIERH